MRKDITNVNEEMEELRINVRVLRREVARSRTESIQQKPFILKPASISSNSNIASAVRIEITRLNLLNHFGSPYENFAPPHCDSVINRESKPM